MWEGGRGEKGPEESLIQVYYYYITRALEESEREVCVGVCVCVCSSE